jgi:hypothetical protein
MGPTNKNYQLGRGGNTVEFYTAWLVENVRQEDYK